VKVRTVIVAALCVAVLLSIAAASTAATSDSKRAARSYRAQAWYIISHVFPPATRWAAYRVASCETVGFTDFLNNGSGAADLFQEMPGNNGRTFTYGRRSMRLNYYRLTRRDHGPPTWYAAQIAYLQSRGGYSWSEWSCKP
jgi:hypothetical protein